MHLASCGCPLEEASRPRCPRPRAGRAGHPAEPGRAQTPRCPHVSGSVGGMPPDPAGWSPTPGGLGAARALVSVLWPGSAQTPTHRSPCRVGSRKVDSGTRPALPGADSSRQCSAERQTSPPPPNSRSQRTSLALAAMTLWLWFWRRGWGHAPPRAPPTLPRIRGTPGFQDKLRKPEAKLSSQGRSCGGRGEAGVRGPGKGK